MSIGTKSLKELVSCIPSASKAGIGLLDEFRVPIRCYQRLAATEDAEDSWWFLWPEGTMVNDQVEKRNYTIGIQP